MVIEDFKIAGTKIGGIGIEMKAVDTIPDTMTAEATTGPFEETL